MPLPVITATQACRSCGKDFTLPSDADAAYLCPHCREPVNRARLAWKSNKNAATLAVLAELVLAVAVLLPFMSVVKLGQAETYSLVGGVAALWRQGEVGLAMVIGGFSLVFPLVKNLLLVAATTTLVPLAVTTRRRLHAFTGHTARLSMLDVFVVAILVVVVKLGDAARVEVRSGTFLFCVAIALSMAASLCVPEEEADERRG
jgi:paraquat-inducible protein A